MAYLVTKNDTQQQHCCYHFTRRFLAESISIYEFRAISDEMWIYFGCKKQMWGIRKIERSCRALDWDLEILDVSLAELTAKVKNEAKRSKGSSQVFHTLTMLEYGAIRSWSDTAWTVKHSYEAAEITNQKNIVAFRTHTQVDSIARICSLVKIYSSSEILSDSFLLLPHCD